VRWCAPCHRRNRLGPSRPSPVLFSVLPSERLTGYDPTHYVRSGLVQRVLQYVTIDAHLRSRRAPSATMRSQPPPAAPSTTFVR
jgi:hypothetical protein